MAVERGEAHGRCVFSLSALKTAKPDWLRDGKINLLCRSRSRKAPSCPMCRCFPTSSQTTTTGQMIDAARSGRPAMARRSPRPPGLPADKRPRCYAAPSTPP